MLKVFELKRHCHGDNKLAMNVIYLVTLIL